MPGLSVVVPVYGCTDCLRALHARLTAALDEIDLDWEIVYVDDCSPGESWPLLVDFAGSDPRVRAYHLSRNFGQSAAIAAGLAHSEGARVVVMDCDLQDPPEEIPLLLARAREGYDVVFTARPAPSYGLGRRLGTAAYFKLRNLVSDRPVLRYSAFSMVSRRAVDAVLSSGDRHRSYLATLLSLDFERAAVEVAREERHAGESSYTLRRLSRVAIGNLRFEVAARLRRVLPGAAASHRGRKGERPYQRPAYIVDVEAAAGPGKRVGSQKESEPQRAR